MGDPLPSTRYSLLFSAHSPLVPRPFHLSLAKRISMTTEAATRADFSHIRYAQVWEDADILLEALEVQPTDTVLSISSAGDNALALLGAGAARVVALDLNPAQLACLELRVAAYRALTHPELLILIGSRPSRPMTKREKNTLNRRRQRHVFQRSA